MGYLDDLIGYKTVRATGSAPVPQRAALSFEGTVTVTDNPLLEQTEVTFLYDSGGGGDDGGGGEGGDGSGPLQAITFEEPQVDPGSGPQPMFIAHEDLGPADVVRIHIEASSDVEISGLDATDVGEDVTRARKTLVNLGPQDLWLVNGVDSTAPEDSRFILPAPPGNLRLRVDQSCDAVYVPAGVGFAAGWRVVS